MYENFERSSDFELVSVRIASPQDIRSWSYGEVKKPETINYRTYRPEKDGLFCERIFGPERDYECFCGKYKGIKYRGLTCSRCGVLVTHSRVRRKRMGHITLAAPVVHIWFFKVTPSRIGLILDVKQTRLERVIYYQDYIVLDPGDTRLQKCMTLTEDEYQDALHEYGDRFKAGMGAEAIKTLLQGVDIEAQVRDLRARLATTTSKQTRKEIVRRLDVLEDILNSGNRPEWMVLEVVPVIPPDLRPLVMLDSGNFATSDLNDLYRRLINRNNRLKKLIELNAPEIIIRNEKRMLQQSVDALFDNNRCRRPVLGPNSRPLRSLSDMIKGKQGRFRENLLGKRVDYSGRSVIVVGPKLKLHQCGFPKAIALELYQPFIIKKLKEKGLATTIRAAKKMLERRSEEVWDILDEVIHDHPVLLNRAPTLHRMGIQAFQPVLVEGNAIEIHPLVCAGFNADFDGDQMAVHLPLSFEAQIEAKLLMMSIHNVFSPAHGGPIIQPSQDMVLGCYWLTYMAGDDKEKTHEKIPTEFWFSDISDILFAMDAGKLDYHTPIVFRTGEREVVAESENEKPHKGRIMTTAGRVVFNDILPAGMPFYNKALDKKGLGGVITECYNRFGIKETLELLDRMKALGFEMATKAGLTFSSEDLKPYSKKEQLLSKTEQEVARIDKAYQKGIITEGERYNQIIDRWTHATEWVTKGVMEELAADCRRDYVNPIYLMVVSGARGSEQQIRQMAGMRGLMAKPSGEIIETPIRANFREGLRMCEYFSSTHGARKGLADTALKTADSGYLSRRLADVAQGVVITMKDCGTLRGVTKGRIVRGDKVELSLADAIRGRVARDTIVDVVTDEVIVRENQLITAEVAKKIEELGYDRIRVRSPLTCEAPRGVCAMCYGMDLSTGRLAEEGLAVGIIAAQSIGEPGTQLTMRTFHIGGAAFRAIEESTILCRYKGRVRVQPGKLIWAVNEENQMVVLNKNAKIEVVDASGRPIPSEGYAPPVGARLFPKLFVGKSRKEARALAEKIVNEGITVEAGEKIAEWDSHTLPILAEKSGLVAFEDIVEGETIRIQVDQTTGARRKVVIAHKGDKHPQILIKDQEGHALAVYPLPEKAYIQVEDGQEVSAGALLAKVPREIKGTEDITGGLPRVQELFEARRPKDPAIMSEIDGVVELGDKRRGKRVIKVKNPETGVEREYLIPPGKHIRVQTGDWVNAGDPLLEGPLVPQDILRVSGVEAVQQYLLNEIQSVYRSQNVKIDDKHIEVIVAQMMRRVRVIDPGDSELLPEQIIDKFEFQKVVRKMQEEGKKPPTAEEMILGITRAALMSDSFISAASFQETTKVLTRAALRGQVDRLEGLKENVILGHMIPAGTGFRPYRRMRVKKEQLVETQEATGEEAATG